MSSGYAHPMPLFQELVDYIIDDLKDDITTLQSCRLVSRDFQRQTRRVDTYLFPKIVFPHSPRCKSALLGIAPHVRTLLVNRKNRKLPTISTTATSDDNDNDFEIEDIFRFKNLQTLGIVGAFWPEPQHTVGSTLSGNVTTLELSAGPSAKNMGHLEIPSVRKLLQLIFAFPNLSSLGLQRVRLASPVGETVDDLMTMSGPTLRTLRLDFQARVMRDCHAEDTFVSVLRAVAIDPNVLEELYISGYTTGIELANSCNALRVLTLIIERVDPDEIAPIPLRHIKSLTIGFHVWNMITYEIHEGTLEWFEQCLLDTTRPTRLQHFALRCNADGGEDSGFFKKELLSPLKPINTIISTLRLKTFTITTSYDDFQDNLTTIRNVSRIHESICAWSGMEQRLIVRVEHEEVESEPGWRVMKGFPILEGWYARTVYEFKRTRQGES
ncbi:hypothetical protein CPB85DRAFT_1336388 [Mucidula mucida]|nr:hypothetical protein CPB85DRAFT_1336388 [Mucidula mucida]